MYDQFSSAYDRFVNWKNRLAFEMPWLVSQLKAIDAHSVIDSACGTGMHVLELVREGFWAAGADISQGMIDVAQMNARAAGLPAVFEVAGFGSVSKAFLEPVDAVLCLGNSLPHILSEEDFTVALEDFAALLKPGGKLLIQNRNFDAVMTQRERWMEPQSYREGETEWIFLRTYDFDPDGLITFNITTLERQGMGEWVQTINSTRLRPILWQDLRSGLLKAGFRDIKAYGSMTGDAFKANQSGNLVVTAIKAVD